MRIGLREPADMRRAFTASLLAAMLTVPLAAALQGPGEGNIDGLLFLTGAWEAHAPGGSLFMFGATPSFSLGGVTGTLTIAHVRTQVYESPIGDVGFEPDMWNETFVLSNATLRIEPGPAFQMALTLTDGSLRSSGLEGERVPVRLEAAPYHYNYRANSSWPQFYRTNVSADALLIGTGETGSPFRAESVDVAGGGQLFLIAGTVEIPTDKGVERRELSERSGPYDSPAGPLPTFRIDEYSFGLLRAERMEAHELRAETTAAYMLEPRVHLDGKLYFPAAKGQLTVADQTFPLSRTAGNLDGTVEIAPRRSTDGKMSYAVQGDISQVELRDGRVYVDPAHAAVGVGGFAALIAAVLWARAGLGYCLAVLYSRFGRHEVLTNKERLRLLELVSKEPGLHLRAIQRRLGFGWGKLHYHLTLLEKAGLVSLQTRGNRRVVSATGHHVEVLSTDAMIRHEIRKAGPLTRLDIARRLGISRQLVAYHVRKLTARGEVVEDETGIRSAS